MREIKFRGLNQNGEWIYGSYVTDYKDFHAIMTQHPFDDERMLQTPVHKETVGQFTGLHDKNGVPIYEGDKVCITDYNDGDFYMAGVVKFGFNGYPAFEIYNGINQTYSDEYNSMSNDGLSLEVIGNIHQKSSELIPCSPAQ